MTSFCFIFRLCTHRNSHWGMSTQVLQGLWLRDPRRQTRFLLSSYMRQLQMQIRATWVLHTLPDKNVGWANAGPTSGRQFRRWANVGSTYNAVWVSSWANRGCHEVNSLHPTGHDDVIKWKHFPRHWPFAWGIHRSLANSPHKGQWRGTLMFYLICSWTNGWVNSRDAGDLRRHRAHYSVTVTVVPNL